MQPELNGKRRMHSAAENIDFVEEMALIHKNARTL